MPEENPPDRRAAGREAEAGAASLKGTGGIGKTGPAPLGAPGVVGRVEGGDDPLHAPEQVDRLAQAVAVLPRRGPPAAASEGAQGRRLRVVLAVVEVIDRRAERRIEQLPPARTPLSLVRHRSLDPRNGRLRWTDLGVSSLRVRLLAPAPQGRGSPALAGAGAGRWPAPAGRRSAAPAGGWRPISDAGRSRGRLSSSRPSARSPTSRHSR